MLQGNLDGKLYSLYVKKNLRIQIQSVPILGKEIKTDSLKKILKEEIKKIK